MEFFARLTELTGELSGLLWGNPLTLLVLLGTGLYLTLRMGLVQVRGFRHSVHLIAGKYSSHRDQGEVSHFQALSTALSATDSGMETSLAPVSSMNSTGRPLMKPLAT